jgi:2-aminoadipate transaminase
MMQMDFQLSQTATGLKRSVMRDLLALVAKPGVLNFAGGLPADENLPCTELQECLDAVLTRDGARALQYGPAYAPLKELIAQHMHTRGVECTADDICITNGNQQGLELCARLFLDGGECVAVEEFTFTGVMQAVQGHGANVLPIAVDLEQGMDVDALESALAFRPRLIITIPDFHNPLGVSLDAKKRERFADLAARYRVPIIEDSPYSPLRFCGEPIPAIKAYDEQNGILYLGSFSKMISPALRLGWMVAPRELLPRLTVLREALDLESSQLMQRTVAEFLARGYLVPHLAQLNAANRRRRDLMLDALQRELDGFATWTVPDGGLFVWLTLPEGTNTEELLHDALKQNVAFVPGFAFAAGQASGRNCMRLNFSNAPTEKIADGIQRLGGVIRAECAVRA